MKCNRKDALGVHEAATGVPRITKRKGEVDGALADISNCYPYKSTEARFDSECLNRFDRWRLVGHAAKRIRKKANRRFITVFISTCSLFSMCD